MDTEENKTLEQKNDSEILLHRKAIGYFKNKNYKIVFLIGLAFILYFVKLIDIIGNGFDDLYIFLDFVSYFAIFMTGVVIFIFIFRDEPDKLGFKIMFIPLAAQLLLSLSYLFYTLSTDDFNIIFTTAFGKQFTFMLFVFLIYYGYIKLKEHINSIEQLIFLISSCIWMIILVELFIKMIGEIGNYYDVEIINDRIENQTIYYILYFLIMVIFIIFPLFNYFPFKGKVFTEKQHIKYSIYLPFIGVIICNSLHEKFDVTHSNELYLILTLIISIVLTGVIFLRESPSTLSKGIYRIFANYFLLNFRILNKYSNLIRSYGKSNDGNLVRNKLLLYFFLKFLRTYVLYTIFVVIVYSSLLLLYPFSSSLEIAEYAEKIPFKDFIWGKLIGDIDVNYLQNSFVPDIFNFGVLFFLYLPLFFLILVVLYEFFEILALKIFSFHIKGDENGEVNI